MGIHLLKLLDNTFVQYLVFLVAGTNLFLFLYAGKFLCASVFILSAIIASFYSKYLVVILVVAMVICNVLCVSASHNEGFKARKKISSAKEKKKSEKKEDSEGGGKEDDKGDSGGGEKGDSGGGEKGDSGGGGKSDNSGGDSVSGKRISKVLDKVARDVANIKGKL